MSFNPMGDNSRWALVLTGQVQPTPEEARILAILKQLGGDAFGAANTPIAPAPNHQPTDFGGLNAIPGNVLAGMQESGGKLLGAAQGGLRGIDQAAGSNMPSQSVYGGVADYVKKLDAAGSAAYGSALSSGPNASASQDRDALKREGPASLSAGDYQQMAASTPMNQDAVSANPEDAYAAAFKAASASGMAPASGGLSDQRRGEQTAGGPVPTGVGNLGGGGGSDAEITAQRKAGLPYTPAGGTGIASSQYPDETNRGLARASSMGGASESTLTSGSKTNPELDYSLAYDQAKSGDGILDMRRSIAEDYEKRPEQWVDDLMAGRGLHPQTNTYAQSWEDTWADKMPLLLDFYVMGKGGDPYNPNDRTKALETFGPEVISGRVHPAQVIQQALNTARGNEDVMNSLIEMGPDAMMGLRVLASGQSRRVASAHNTTLRRKVGEERRRQIAAARSGGPEPDASRYVDIVSGRG